MKKIISLSFLIALFFPVISLADPMGLSDYVIRELSSDGKTWQDRRLTNHEVDQFKAVGEILPDGTVLQHKDDQRAIGGDSQVAYKPDNSTPDVAAVATKPPHSKNIKGQNATRKIVSKPLPSKHDIAQTTKTKPSDHASSKGTIHVRPANFPDNPTEQDIIRMQQHIQHIERTVGKALDLSLSAYAVAELPQATQGRSGISVGAASSDGKTAEAIGFSSNFGDSHEYTVKISLSHSGHEEAVGAGFGWQW